MRPRSPQCYRTPPGFENLSECGWCPCGSCSPGLLATVIQPLRRDVHELDQAATSKEVALSRIKRYRVIQDLWLLTQLQVITSPSQQNKKRDEVGLRMISLQGMTPPDR